jgi:hypothetical protein
MIVFHLSRQHFGTHLRPFIVQTQNQTFKSDTTQIHTDIKLRHIKHVYRFLSIVLTVYEMSMS